MNKNVLTKISKLNQHKLRIARMKTVETIVGKPLPGIHDKIFHNNPSFLGPKIDAPIPQASDFKPGDSAPLAYQARRDFPEWYKPYHSNYHGHGFLILFLLGTSFFAYIQYERTLLYMGRKEIVEHPEDHQNAQVIHLFKQFRQASQIYNNTKIDIFNYTKRYMKESGF